MRIGYVKEISKSNSNKIADMLKAERIFVDKPGEDSSLHDAVKYSRPGDIIVVRSIREISSTAGGFVEFVIQVKKIGVNVLCKEEGVDTSSYIWAHLTETLTVYDKGRSSDADAMDFIGELDRYFDMVEAGEITVQEVCETMQIGKSTYYRHWRQRKKKPVASERHPELFNEYVTKVESGEMTVVDACKHMGIGVTTYYRMKKKQ